MFRKVCAVLVAVVFLMMCIPQQQADGFGFLVLLGDFLAEKITSLIIGTITDGILTAIAHSGTHSADRTAAYEATYRAMSVRFVDTRLEDIVSHLEPVARSIVDQVAEGRDVDQILRHEAFEMQAAMLALDIDPEDLLVNDYDPISYGECVSLIKTDANNEPHILWMDVNDASKRLNLTSYYDHQTKYGLAWDATAADMAVSDSGKVHIVLNTRRIGTDITGNERAENYLYHTTPEDNFELSFLYGANYAALYDLSLDTFGEEIVYAKTTLSFPITSAGWISTYIDVDNRYGIMPFSMRGEGHFATSLRMDSEGGVHVVYYDPNEQALKYAVMEASSLQNFDPATMSAHWVHRMIFEAQMPALDALNQATYFELDSNDIPHVVFRDRAGAAIYAYYDPVLGLFRKKQIPGYGHLQLDAKDRPYIMYQDTEHEDGHITIGVLVNQTDWYDIRIKDAQKMLRGSFALDRQGHAHISYVPQQSEEGGPKPLLYATTNFSLSDLADVFSGEELLPLPQFEEERLLTYSVTLNRGASFSSVPLDPGEGTTLRDILHDHMDAISMIVWYDAELDSIH